MNRKIFIVLIHICFGILLLSSINYINHIEYEKVDVATLNRIYQEVEDAYQRDTTDIAMIEEEYDCDIALLQDRDYQQVMYKAIKEGYAAFDLYNEDLIIGKIIFNNTSVRYTSLKKEIVHGIMWCIGITLIIYDISALFVHIYYVRPFKKLSYFASEVAKGNLDVPLEMNKHNYFGVFTESFDVMREELKVARQREYEANQSKKELIASLSHDMKTPIATIEASCELLMLQLKDNPNIDKIQLIAERAQMINNLINNMFHATLEELEALEVNVREEPSTILYDIVKKTKLQGNIDIVNECPECLINVDKLRITQVIDNIVNNSKKYAGTQITISFEEVEHGIIIKLRDYGPGVPTKSLPQLTEKFYRADNTQGKTGAGLGMYLANYFMNCMGGEMEYYNDSGFVVELFLSKC